MLMIYALLLLVHLECNIFFIYVTCMILSVLTINCLTMQQSHFLYILNQTELILKHAYLHWE